MLRDNVSKGDVLNRIRNQIAEHLIIDKCDYIIDNIDLNDLEKKVTEINNSIISLN